MNVYGDDDPVSAARGCVIALVVGAVTWIIVALAVWMIVRWVA